MKLKKFLILVQLALLGMCLGLSSEAWANLAANTQIINQATLSYYDGVSTKTANASVTVTVNLVPAAVTIVPGGNQSTSYATGATLTDSFTVTAGANGPDTYNITSAVTGSTNTSGAAATPTSTIVALGATVTVAGSTTTVLVVPADGNLSGEMPGVNGIAVGDTVVISGQVRTVTAITDNASGTSTITLNTALSSAPAAGILVAEQKVIQATVTPGTITTPGTDVTVSVTATVVSQSSSGATATSTPAILNTFSSGAANLTKYVRNVSKASGTGTAYIYNSTNYYQAGVTAAPGETLEYILVAANSSTSGPVTAAVITDSVPTSFVTFKTGAYSGGKDVTYVSDTNAVSYYTSASDTDQATYSAPTLTVYVGTGATSSAGGSIPASGRVLVLYQVTVNN